ncbi:unnamed protein product [Periconia digitata]|uniref:Rhodopsin domain-containing protein n=1 Tax=Periconia digitata TaxID=1303443 RepID=A0A9W4XRT2_9PLEO|nr:unnamed protein product [Periconia digitata]
MEKCLAPNLDINACPGLMPPPGVVPFSPNAPSRSNEIVVTVAVCFALAVPAVAIRIFTKAYILKQMHSEDYALILSLVGYTALTGLALKCYDYFEGKHQWDVTVANVMHTFQIINWAQLIYVFPVFLAKYALLRQIGRIFPSTSTSPSYINMAAWFLIFANLVLYIVVFFVFLLGCIPREKIWKPYIKGRCVDTGSALLATSVINIASDVAILVLPLFGVARLKMPWRMKLGVVGIFATGGLAIVVCVLRVYYTVLFNRDPDKTWALIPLSLFGIAEVATMILCCCFVTFPRFFTWLRSGGRDRSVWTSTGARSGGGGGAGASEKSKSKSWFRRRRSRNGGESGVENRNLNGDERSGGGGGSADGEGSEGSGNGVAKLGKLPEAEEGWRHGGGAETGGIERTTQIETVERSVV